jgi:hypothetical protein
MHMIGRGSWYGFALSALSGLLLSGCGTEFDEAPADLESRESPALVCNQPNGCCDPAIYESCSASMRSAPSGHRIVVTTFICLTTPSSTTPSATCRVHPTDHAIGGGAWVQGAVGAAPTSSLPISGLGGGWKATSAGIVAPVAHGLKTYAIGLQVLDTSFRPINIANDIHRYDFTANASDPSRIVGSVRVAGGHVLVGGGWSASGGAFAVDAFASGMSGGKWTVTGNQFRAGVPKLSGVAMAVSRCLPAANPSFCFGSRDIIQETSADGTGIQGIAVNNPHSELFVVGVGVISSSWDRPIWGLFPLKGSAASPYGVGAAFTVGPTAALGNVTTQVMTMGI